MLPPNYLRDVAEPVLETYRQVEEDIAVDMARRLVKEGRFTDTAKWQYEKAMEFGYQQAEIVKILSRATGKSEKQIIRILRQAGVKAISKDDEIYRRAGLEPTPIYESKALESALIQGTDSTLNLIGNYTKTTALSANRELNNIFDRVFLQVESGAFDLATALRNGVKELAQKNFDLISYPSGATISLEAGIRRAVVTGVNQTASKMQLVRADEMGCEFVEVTSHVGARPSHAEWQGKVYHRGGAKDGYADFETSTGYGTGAGLCGWNCYHNFFPFFPDIQEQTFSKDPAKDIGKDNDEEYYKQQKQRYYERQVRQAKRECAVYDEAIRTTKDQQLAEMLKPEFEHSAVKLKRREAKLNQYVKENNLVRFKDREQVNGFDRSVSQKAVHANKNYLKNHPKNTSKAVPKKAEVNIKDRQSAYEALTKDVGFTGVMPTMKAVNEETLIANTKQIRKLESKFGVIHKSNLEIQSSRSQHTCAYVESYYTEPARGKLSLCIPRFSQSVKDLEQAVYKETLSKWAMPCKKENSAIYEVTHEYGHMIQNWLMQKEYIANGWTAEKQSTFIDTSKRTKNAQFKWYIKAREKVQKKCYEEITEIAKKNNPNFDLASNLSQYGKTNLSEFFAEVFANSQCGEPNELGKAMIEWLKEQDFK